MLEAFVPDGNNWLPWAVTTTAVCTLLTVGIVTTARMQMFASMVVFAVMWALSTVSGFSLLWLARHADGLDKP